MGLLGMFRMQFFAAVFSFLLIQDMYSYYNIYISCYSTMMLYFIVFDYIISYCIISRWSSVSHCYNVYVYKCHKSHIYVVYILYNFLYSKKQHLVIWYYVHHIETESSRSTKWGVFKPCQISWQQLWTKRIWLSLQKLTTHIIGVSNIATHFLVKSHSGNPTY